MDRKKIVKTGIVTGVILSGSYIILNIVAKLKGQNKKINAELQKDQYMNAGKTAVKRETGVYEKNVKGALDKCLSFLGLLFLMPFFVIVSFAIYIDDPGPVFFTQKRVGKNKEYFMLHKFRTMKMCTPHDVPTHMLENPEQYITRVGRILRKYSLDEFPQVWDIFVGNMSLVGPRPALWNQYDLVAERDKYGANDVRPGLTGWAQINGRDELEIEIKAKFDGEYVSNISLFFDVKCLIGTVKSVLKHEGVVEGGTGELNRYISNDELFAPVNFPKELKLDMREPKRILIAGAGSFIGESFKQYMEQWAEIYDIDVIDVVGELWKEHDFSSYDVVYDVAGIAHIKETDENRRLYYTVNKDLAVEIAEKAKKDGVSLFIYLSSMSIYGLTVGKITKDTSVNAINAYGKSKLEAERTLHALADEKFHIAIVKPPMVYGNGCKGNYQRLRTFALKCAFFPRYENERSMLYIDNLSSAIRGIIHYGVSGSYYPQNVEYVNTWKMVKDIAEFNGKRVFTTGMINRVINIFGKKVQILQKVFGSLVYDQDMNVPADWIDVKDTSETIRYTEKGRNYKVNSGKYPKVTILSVALNSEKTIAKTIESVLHQTYHDIEYIIFDGNSKDNTVKIAKDYQEIFNNTPGRSLTVVSESDNGMYDALNKGARLATGELVGQINTDDWYERDAVEYMVKVFMREKCDVAWGDIRIIKPSGNMIKHAKIGRIWTTSGWCHPGMFSKREILLEFPYACESIYDDFDFITSVYQAKKRIITTNHLISNFSFGGMSTKKDLREVKKRIDILYKVYRKHGLSRLYWFHRVAVEMAKYIWG